MVVGFAGAVIILDPWADVFQWASFLPIGADTQFMLQGAAGALATVRA